MTEKNSLSEDYDRSIRPQDDLFRHVNGNWLDNHVIPEDQASDGTFYEIREKTRLQLEDIINDLNKKEHLSLDEENIKNLYQSYLDENKLNILGILPLKEDLDKIFNIDSVDSLIKHLAYLNKRNDNPLFVASISSDAKDSNRNVPYLHQSGLGLPDESYYREGKYETLRVKYLDYITDIFSIAKISDPGRKANIVLALEKSIASHHWDQVKDRDATLTYNTFSLRDLQNLTPNIFWEQYFNLSDQKEMLAQPIFIVSQPSFFEGINTMLSLTSIEKWQAYLAFHLINDYSPYLSSDFSERKFAFFGTTLAGVPSQKPRSLRAVSLTESALGEVMGKLYIEKHFSASAKVEMDKLVNNLLEAYRQSIDDLSWMSPTTKSKAHEKLSTFRPKIGFPDKWRDYSTLKLANDNLIDNIHQISKRTVARSLEKLSNPVDKDEWFMTPQTINAYYNPLFNEIVFPAGILQSPFFDTNRDPAENYGAIGAVIGHEISHGFDDQGAKYDSFGNLEDWWNEEDLLSFQKLSKKVIDQYNGISPYGLPDLKINGSLTVGENIGDISGLKIAYKAYEISLRGEEPEIIDGLTGPQRFFIGWAKAWKNKQRPETLSLQIQTDPHSPTDIRVNQVVRNLTSFYEAFGVDKGDKLYLPLEERIDIW